MKLYWERALRACAQRLVRGIYITVCVKFMCFGYFWRFFLQKLHYQQNLEKNKRCIACKLTQLGSSIFSKHFMEFYWERALRACAHAPRHINRYDIIVQSWVTRLESVKKIPITFFEGLRCPKHTYFLKAETLHFFENLAGVCIFASKSVFWASYEQVVFWENPNIWKSI